MIKIIANWLQRQRPEDPLRIRVFRSNLEGLSWDHENTLKSLSVLFAAVDDLADAEIRYYYRRRGTRAWISGITRFGGWMLGSIGLLLPLLAATDFSCFKDGAQLGYVFLAAAASCLAANALFGGTEGHIRFVSTQLEIERLITASRVGWCKYLAGTPEEVHDLNEGFTLILEYSNALHTATITETGRWGKTLLMELEKYQRSIAAKSKAE